jgi:hypothetical protein
MSPATRRAFLAAAVLAAAVAVAVALFVRRERAPRPIRITGKTLAAGGAPLPDVRIVLEVTPGDSEDETAVERVETLSDAKGDFTIDFVGHWRRASYRLEAQKPGFQKLSIDDARSLSNPVILRLPAALP